MINKVIYCFWTGNNEMSYNRKRCLDSMNKSEFPIILITSKNLESYTHIDFPLHPGYEYLSLTHKSDYLRCYFMHHYGGGYCDIKEINTSWNGAFKDIEDPNCHVNGYQEIGPTGVAPVGGELYSVLKQNYKSLIGCGSFICKPKTIFTHEWISELHKKLDTYYPILKQYPAKYPQDQRGMFFNGEHSKYPIAWTEIMGNIFHPLCFKYNNHIKQTVPPCIFKSYR